MLPRTDRKRDHGLARAERATFLVQAGSLMHQASLRAFHPEAKAGSFKGIAVCRLKLVGRANFFSPG
jgi:hypothetical protein